MSPAAPRRPPPYQRLITAAHRVTI